MKREDLKVGMPYKSMTSSIVVVCTDLGSESCFNGIVVAGDCNRKIGHYSDGWRRDGFEKSNIIFNPNRVVLEEGKTYLLPNDCEVVVKENGDIKVINNAKYHKSKLEIYTVYYRVTKDVLTRIKMGNIKKEVELSNREIEPGSVILPYTNQEITKEEFDTALEEALKLMKS